MINKQDCKYGDNCTFAYHQEEIDVWTEERKGTLNRDLLFDPLGGVKRGSLTIAKLLKEHQGIFTFLCEVPPPPAIAAQTGLGRGSWHPPVCQPWAPGFGGPALESVSPCAVRKIGPRDPTPPQPGSHPAPSFCGGGNRGQKEK